VIPACLPKGWLSAPLKRFLSVSSGDMISADEETPEGYPIYGGNGIRGYTDKINTKAPALVIGRVGAKCGNVHLVEEDFWASEHALVVYPRKKFDLRYGKYLLSALNLNQFAIRTAQPLINTDAVVTQIGSWPVEIKTQRRIADYLDRETARIDALIAEKEKMLALLEEKRTALISRAVTRGLNPDAPMKPSGLDWLGDIPAHWEVVQVRFVCPDLQTGPFGSQLHADEYIDHGVPVINPAHLRGNEIEPDYGISVDEATADRLRMHRLKTGDVVFARRGELGRCGVTKSEQAGWLCGTGSLRVRCDLRRTNPHYLALVFNSTNAAKRLTVESVGSTMDNLNTEMLGHFRIPFPELDEQNSIVSYVFVVEEKVRALMEVLRRSIDLAKERRAALITAAVNGRIDLEGMAA